MRRTSEEFYEMISNSEIGKDNVFIGPFGQRTLIYCDYASTGRSLDFIEDFIKNEILPAYGSTQMTTNFTTSQTTLLHNEARCNQFTKFDYLSIYTYYKA